MRWLARLRHIWSHRNCPQAAWRARDTGGWACTYCVSRWDRNGRKVAR